MWLKAPVEFVFFIAGIMLSWYAVSDYPLCVLRSRNDYVLSGRRYNAGSAADDFTVSDSRYADDTAVAFCTRADLNEQTAPLWLIIATNLSLPLIFSSFITCEGLQPRRRGAGIAL